MAKANKLNPGDRIAYAAKFLKNTGQFTGPGGQRRGTFVAYDKSAPQFARVNWDDFDVKASGEQWGEDYAIDAALNGQMVHADNIAKVGSPRFAVNDI